jgi:NADH-quinone oxidoreductase subunit K
MNYLLGITATLLFIFGIAGVLLKRNPLVIFMSIELMLNAVNLGLMIISRTTQKVDAQILTIFLITIAAAEVVIGLGIIVTLFSDRDDVDVDNINLLKG